MKKPNNQIKTKYFIGVTNSYEWSSVYFYSPQIPAIFEQKGEIFSVISLSGPVTFDSDKAGNMLLDQLHEIYFESEEENQLLALEKAVLSVKKRLLELIANDEVSAEQGIELNLSAFVVHEDTGYMVNMGESKIYGLRDAEMSQISSVLKDPDGKDEIIVGSLSLKNDDRFILLTQEADSELTFKEKEKVLLNFSTDLISGKNLVNEAKVSTMLFGINIVEEDELEYVKQSNELGVAYAQDIDEEMNDFETRLEGKQFSMSRKEVEGTQEINKNEDDTLPLKISRQVEQEKEIDDFEDEVLIDEGDQTINVKDKLVSQISGKLKNFNLNQSVQKAKNKFEDIKYQRNAKTFQVVIVKAFNFIAENIGRGLRFLWSDVLQIGGNKKRNVYVKGSRGGTNWRPIILIGFVVVLLLFFTFTSVKKRNEEKARILAVEKELETIESQKNSLSNEARTIINTYDREDAKTKVYNSVVELKTRLATINEFEDKKQKINSELNDIENRLNRKIEVDNSAVVKDLGGLIEGIEPSDIDVYNQNIYISDKKTGVIFEFDLDGGSMKRVAEGLDEPRTISVSKDGTLVFVDNGEDRALGGINLETNVVEKYLGVSRSKIGEISHIDAYNVSAGDDRVYAARINTKEIIQHKKYGDIYSLPEPRLSLSDFSNLLDVEVNDGRIYVVSEGQGVRRFFGESEFDTSLSGLINGDSWNNASSIYIDNKYIYVGDNVKKRVMVFTKNRGTEDSIIDFIAQYDLSGVLENEEIEDIAGFEGNKYLYALAGTKILKLDLSLTQGLDY